MIVATILYPKSDGSTFDMDYYTSSHMPMFAEVFGDACQGWGVADVDDDTYHAFAWVSVDSREAFDAALAEHGAKVMGDIPNYTSARPQMIVGKYAGGA
jgi:uncharacterized protein (TIGR02118 family)